MNKKTIITRFRNISLKAQRKEFIDLLNDIKKDEYGDLTYKFRKSDIKKFRSSQTNTNRYQVFNIPKKSGGMRQIAAPVPMLKSLLRIIKLFLEAFYNPMQCVQGFTNGRSIIGNAGSHLYQNYVYNIDLSNFFPTIKQGRIWKRLQLPPYNFPEGICDIIAGTSCVKYSNEDGTSYSGLPQGAPTSPILSNIICEQLDRRLTGLAKRFGLHYTRYADDMTFSSMHNVYQDDSDFIKELRRIIKDQGFTLNEKKTRLQKNGSRQEVTGLTIGIKTNVTRSYIKFLRSVLHVWEKYGYAHAYAWFYTKYKDEKGHSQKGEPVLENIIDGKLNFLKMVKGETDSTYKTLRQRFDNLMVSINENKSMRHTRRVIVSYTLEEFRKRFIGVEMEFKSTPNGYISGTLNYDGIRTPIYFDKIFRESKPGIKANVISAIKKHDSDWHISEIEDKDRYNPHIYNHFWLISKYEPKITTASIADTTVKRLLTIWETEGLDAAVKKWKSLQMQQDHDVKASAATTTRKKKEFANSYQPKDIITGQKKPSSSGTSNYPDIFNKEKSAKDKEKHLTELWDEDAAFFADAKLGGFSDDDEDFEFDDSSLTELFE